MSYELAGGFLLGVALVAWGFFLGYRSQSKRYWEGFDRGYKQAESDLYGLPDSVPEIKG